MTADIREKKQLSFACLIFWAKGKRGLMLSIIWNEEIMQNLNFFFFCNYLLDFSLRKICTINVNRDFN